MQHDVDIGLVPLRREKGQPLGTQQVDWSRDWIAAVRKALCPEVRGSRLLIMQGTPWPLSSGSPSQPLGPPGQGVVQCARTLAIRCRRAWAFGAADGLRQLSPPTAQRLPILPD